MNRVCLLGNIGADPELRMTSGGQACLKFSLATSETWKDKAGAKQERTEWHRIVMWGTRAEALSKHLAKGQKVAVEGKIAYGKYDDKNGVTRYTTDIIVDNLHFAGGARNEGGGSPYGGGYQDDGKDRGKKAEKEDNFDDLPF